MKKLLHIIATPRGADSRTLKASKAFLDVLSKRYPSCIVEELNVATAKLPSLSVEVVAGKYVLLTGKDLSLKLQKIWKSVLREIEHFLSQDAYLVSTPMWNFGIPYTLKHYIDIIVQPKYLFQYTDKGIEGLAKNKKMAVIISRGGDYSPESPFSAYNLQEPYLRTVFGFVGITDIEFVVAEPMDMDRNLAEKRLKEAIIKAKGVAEKF